MHVTRGPRAYASSAAEGGHCFLLSNYHAFIPLLRGRRQSGERKVPKNNFRAKLCRVIVGKSDAVVGRTAVSLGIPSV